MFISFIIIIDLIGIKTLRNSLNTKIFKIIKDVPIVESNKIKKNHQ